MKKSEILRGAKGFLSLNNPYEGTRFICWSIDHYLRASGGHRLRHEHEDEVYAIRADVYRYIIGCSTFEEFLEQQHELMYHTPREVQKLRHDLVDKLIIEYELKGE